jgi:hypothetical protein
MAPLGNQLKIFCTSDWLVGQHESCAVFPTSLPHGANAEPRHVFWDTLGYFPHSVQLVSIQKRNGGQQLLGLETSLRQTSRVAFVT